MLVVAVLLGRSPQYRVRSHPQGSTVRDERDLSRGLRFITRKALAWGSSAVHPVIVRQQAGDKPTIAEADRSREGKSPIAVCL